MIIIGNVIVKWVVRGAVSGIVRIVIGSEIVRVYRERFSVRVSRQGNVRIGIPRDLTFGIMAILLLANEDNNNPYDTFNGKLVEAEN